MNAGALVYLALGCLLFVVAPLAVALNVKAGRLVKQAHPNARFGMRLFPVSSEVRKLAQADRSYGLLVRATLMAGLATIGLLIVAKINS